MLLDDLAGGAGREGVAARGEIGAGDRLGDRAGDRAPGTLTPCRSCIAAVGRRPARESRLAPVMRIDGEHVADPVDHGDDAGQAARLRLGDAPGR